MPPPMDEGVVIPCSIIRQALKYPWNSTIETTHSYNLPAVAQVVQLVIKMAGYEVSGWPLF